MYYLESGGEKMGYNRLIEYFKNAFNTINKQSHIKDISDYPDREIIDLMRHYIMLRDNHLIDESIANYMLRQFASEIVQKLMEKDIDNYSWEENLTKKEMVDY